MQTYADLIPKGNLLVRFDPPLLSKTSEKWCRCVTDNFDVFLIDHADCERKAAVTALALMRNYPEKIKLIEPMIALAREELAHYHDVHKIMLKRGIIATKSEPDTYTRALRKHARDPRGERLLDLLLLSGIIEARAHDRLKTLAPYLTDPELRSFYTHLANIEAGHFKIFFQSAMHYYPEVLVKSRISELVAIEDGIFQNLPLEPRIH